MWSKFFFRNSFVLVFYVRKFRGQSQIFSNLHKAREDELLKILTFYRIICIISANFVLILHFILQKRQKFSTESEKMEELTENSYSMDQHTVSEVVQDANEQSEMYDEEMSESSQDSNFTSKESEEENEIKEGIVTNTYAHLQR